MSVNRTNTTYAATQGTIGYLAQVLMGDGASPEVFEAIAYVKAVSFGETSVADVNRTHLRSPGAHHEHAPGMLDSGPITFSGIYAPDEWSLSTAGGGTGPFAAGGLPFLAQQRGVHNFVFRHPNGTDEVEVTGYLMGFSLSELSLEGVIEYKCGVMPTQAYVLP